MSHELTNNDATRLGLLKARAWHGLGTVIQDELSAVQAGERFGMFEQVNGWKLSATCPTTGRTIEVPTHVANVMAQPDGTDGILGVVGCNYAVLQNRQLAEAADALAQHGQAIVETCGTIRDGKKVWFLCRGEEYKIGGGDVIHPYLLVSNSHNGESGIQFTPTSVRAVCSNTLHQIIPNSGNARRSISLRHTGSLSDKIEQVKMALAEYAERTKRHREACEKLADTDMTFDEATAYFSSMYVRMGFATPSQTELNSTDKKVRALATRRAKKMKDAHVWFMDRWNDEKKALGLKESRWLAFNAFSGVIQHDIPSERNAKSTNNAHSRLFGNAAKRTSRAFEAAHPFTAS